MRHRKLKSRLGKTTSHKKAMMKNLACALIEHERIHTTYPKARELRTYIEKLITLGKEGSLKARRNAFGLLQNKKAVHKLFEEIAPRFSERNGGYTRVVHDGPRHGDCAPMSYIELVERVEKEVKPKKKKRERPSLPGM